MANGTKSLSEQIWARISPIELEAMDAAATRVGKSRSAFIRYCIIYTLNALRAEPATPKQT